MEGGRPVTATLKNRRVKTVNINMLSPHGAVVKHLADICTCGRTKVVGSNPTGVKVFKLRFLYDSPSRVFLSLKD